jgi:hypothetical protein
LGSKNSCTPTISRPSSVNIHAYPVGIGPAGLVHPLRTARHDEDAGLVGREDPNVEEVQERQGGTAREVSIGHRLATVEPFGTTGTGSDSVSPTTSSASSAAKPA